MLDLDGGSEIFRPKRLLSSLCRARISLTGTTRFGDAEPPYLVQTLDFVRRVGHAVCQRVQEPGMSRQFGRYLFRCCQFVGCHRRCVRWVRELVIVRRDTGTRFKQYRPSAARCCQWLSNTASVNMLPQKPMVGPSCSFQFTSSLFSSSSMSTSSLNDVSRLTYNTALQ